MRSKLIAVVLLLAGMGYGQNPTQHTFTATDSNSTITGTWTFNNPVTTPEIKGTNTPLAADDACTSGSYWIAPIGGSVNSWHICNNGSVINVSNIGFNSTAPGPIGFTTPDKVNSTQYYLNGAVMNPATVNSGVNSNITQLTGLSTPLSVAQGGSGATTATQAITNLGGVHIAGDTMTGQLIGPSFTMTASATSGFNFRNGSGTLDTSMQRSAAATVVVGNGSQGDASGTVKAAVLQASTAFTSPFYTDANAVTTTLAIAPVLNKIVGRYFRLTNPVTVTNICLDPATADNTANKYDLGISDSSGTLLVHTGATAGTTFAPNTSTFCHAVTSTVLNPGAYWVELTTNCTSGCAQYGVVNTPTGGYTFNPGNSNVGWGATVNAVLPSSSTLPSFSYGASSFFSGGGGSNTFGTSGGGGDNFDGNFILNTPFTPSVNLTVQKCSENFEAIGGGSSWQCAIYADSGGLPGSLLCSSGSGSVALGDNNITLGSCPVLTANTQYWLSINTNSSSNDIGCVADGGIYSWYVAQGFGSWPNPQSGLSGAACRYNGTVTGTSGSTAQQLWFYLHN